MDTRLISSELFAAPPILTQLGLDESDLASLRHQGSVAGEYRERNGRRFGPYYKLRWRRDGRQCVRYLGRDRDHAREVEAALAAWQQPMRLEREIRGRMTQARKSLRRLKVALAPTLIAAGGQWHGYHARRQR